MTQHYIQLPPDSAQKINSKIDIQASIKYRTFTKSTMVAEFLECDLDQLIDDALSIYNAQFDIELSKLEKP